MYKPTAKALQGNSKTRRARTLAISLGALFIGASFYAHHVRAETRSGPGLHPDSNAGAFEAPRGQARA